MGHDSLVHGTVHKHSDIAGTLLSDVYALAKIASVIGGGIVLLLYNLE